MSVTFTGEDFRSEPIAMRLYSDGTPLAKTEQFSEIVDKADTAVLRADSLVEFMFGMFLVDSITYYGGEITRLVLPYLPGARQDRSNPTGDVLFAAQSIADEINMRAFDEVISVDPHSPVMPRLIDGFVEYPLKSVYKRLWKGYTGVIAPDAGAQMRAAIAAGSIKNVGYMFAEKTRDVSTGRLSGFRVPELVKGGHYIVVDDICDGGGTFLGLGEKIAEQGAYADLFVTHGIFAKGVNDLKRFYKNIYTTNTRIHDVSLAGKIMVFDVVTEMENI